MHFRSPLLRIVSLLGFSFLQPKDCFAAIEVVSGGFSAPFAAFVDTSDTQDSPDSWFNETFTPMTGGPSQFNPNLGTLQCVTVDISFSIYGSVTSAMNPDLSRVRTDVEVPVSAVDSSVGISFSGSVSPDLTSDDSYSTTFSIDLCTSNLLITPWIGLGEVDFTTSVDDWVWMEPSGSESDPYANCDGLVSCLITATYTYTPGDTENGSVISTVPEPMSLATLTMAALPILFLRHRR